MKEKYSKDSSGKRRSDRIKVDSKRIMMEFGLAFLAVLAVSSVVGSAQTFISSTNVLEIDGSGVGGVGGPISSTLFTGGPFNAGVVNWNHVPVGSFSSVGSNDTVVLFQVNTVTELTAAQKATLVSFVTGGGKLIIWDSDAGATTTTPNDYSWLPAKLNFNTSVPGQLGLTGGILMITEENDLSSNISSNPKFINTSNIIQFTDAVGDANVVKTNGTDWCQDMFAQNRATPPQAGPGHMYSRLGGSVGNGFIVYSALDWDFAASGGIGGDELRKMMQFELEVNHTSRLPCTVTVVPQEGSISGTKFNDLNGNGTRDVGEPGLANWTITLKNSTGAIIATTMTASDGSYEFSNLSADNYTVGEVLQAGWTQTAPQPIPPGTYTVTLSAGQIVTGLDFGNKINLCPTGDCKFKTWGTLGNVANPEKKFEMLFFSPIPNGGPQGRMKVEDNKLGMTIESTRIDTVVTDKNAGTGTATGRAHVTGGPHPGDYDFTVNVKEAAQSNTPRGTFELILSGFPGGYDNSGPLTFGAISIIK
jgi:hypothetical protein